MNQQWLINHVLNTRHTIPVSPSDDREYLTREDAERIVDETLDHAGAHGDETEYTYMRGHRERFIHALTLIPKADSENTRLLDVGSYGYMGFWAFRHLGYQSVVGIEWHPDIEQRIIHRELRVGSDVVEIDSHNFDICNPDWDLDGQFDTVLFFEVLEHINSDPMGVMERINACMRLGGTLVMSVPNAISYKTLREFLVGMPPWTYWFYEPDLSHEPRHCFEYTPIVFHSLLTASGMQTEAFRTIFAYTSMSNERDVLGVAETLGFDPDTFGETMIAQAVKNREGVPLRYPDVLYSPDGYYSTVYPMLREVLEERLGTLKSLMADQDPDDSQPMPADQLIELKTERELLEVDGIGLIESLKGQLAEMTQSRDQHRDWASGLQEESRSLESHVTQLLFQSDCWMQREQELNAEMQAAKADLEQAQRELINTQDWGNQLSQENADLRAHVDQLLFACDCYLQQINDPERCVRVIRERRFRRVLDRSKSIARKTPVARTVLRPVYRNAKKFIKRRM